MAPCRGAQLCNTFVSFSDRASPFAQLLSHFLPPLLPSLRPCSLSRLQLQPRGAQHMIGQLKLALTRRVVCGAVAMGKRKAQFKLYAVRVGRRTGIFHSWDDCVRQVSFEQPHDLLPPHKRMCHLCCSAALCRLQCLQPLLRRCTASRGRSSRALARKPRRRRTWTAARGSALRQPRRSACQQACSRVRTARSRVARRPRQQGVERHSCARSSAHGCDTAWSAQATELL